MLRLRKGMALVLLMCLSAFSVMAQPRPNIVVILADDMGYSDPGSYGGEVSTPNLDALASGGIRYRQFYNAARCCPTRASLMTGVYPHQAGMGWMAAAHLGTPAYQGTLNNQCVTIAEVLKDAGYGTYMTGKWHLTNERKIDGLVTESWPKQRGFDQYFGIIPGGANYFTPVLYSNNQRYPAPPDFYLTDAISDTTVKYIDHHFANEKTPMFMYVAYTSPHWPLHARKKEISKYKERYERGWDSLRKERFERQKSLGVISKATVLSPRDPAVESWASLTQEKKNEMAMRMAIYAAQIDIMDQGIGRIVNKLREKGQLENTLIFFLSDNGACAEHISSGKSKDVTGQQDTFESYRIQWANMGSTPFREYKHYTYEGGIATPLIAHWPSGIDRKLQNRFIDDYGHVSDIMATCIDIAKTKYPVKYKGNPITPLQGKSLTPHFKGMPNHRGKIYWEHEANIAVREGKWKLVAKTPEGATFSKESLELFDMVEDPSEMNDLSARYPAKVKNMYDAWFQWADAIGVFPLDTRKYGVRMDAYRATVNGTFDDKLGGWNLKKINAVSATLEIDTTGQLGSGNAVKVFMSKPGNGPDALAMVWDVKASRGQKYQIRLSSRSDSNSSFFLRFRPVGKDIEILNHGIHTTPRRAETISDIFEIPENGFYQIALCFGNLKSGDLLWVDNVELVPVPVGGSNVDDESKK